MFLARLRATNFRSCDETVVHFHEDLTILAGENNAGKTNILDAIRFAMAPSEPRVARFAGPEDIRRDVSPAALHVQLEFDGVTDAQRGAFITALEEPLATTAIYGSTYTAARPGERRGTATRWVGKRRSSDPEPAARELLRYVHLPALRDAARELASSSPGRIEFLLKQTASEEQQRDLVRASAAMLGDLAGHEVIDAVARRVGERFRPLTLGAQVHDASLSFSDTSLAGIARDLRFKLAQQGLAPSVLGESGLGYANLLYFASVVVELNAAHDAELTVFLVEEPEAHLHPQLQAVTLEFLRAQAEESKKRERKPGERDGRIQVVATSHSPNLTASVSLEHVTVLRPTVIESPRQGNAEGPGAPVTVSRAVGMRTLGLSKATIGKVNRYLDVTRSALLFSRRVLLVEGIAEALLLPVFARALFATRPDHLARFRGATTVAIDGVDFEPYLRLLLTLSDGHRIADRVVVLTDEDPGTNGEDRPRRLRELAESLSAGHVLHVRQTPHTLEAALFQSLRGDEMKNAFLALHPRSQEKWNVLAASDPATRAADFVVLLKESDTKKGDFAQRLAEELNDVDEGQIPNAIRSALNDLVAVSTT